jgi:hypothetical protein
VGPAAARGRWEGGDGGGRCGGGASRGEEFVRAGGAGEWSEWVPPSRRWRRDPLYRGDGNEFLVHVEKKREL